jgi:PST family polysaccharide transporter
MFSVAMARVSVASFGRVQHDPAAVRAQFTRYLGGLMALTIPVAVLLCVLALPLVRVVYGSEWDAAAIALHFLVVVGVARVALQLANDLLVGVGNGSATFRLQGLWFAVALPALAVGAHVDGIRGVGIAHMVVALLVVTPAFLVVLRRFGVTPADAAGAIARPALGGLLAAGGAGLALFAFSSAFVQLAVGGTIGVVVYALVVIPRYADLRSRSAVAAVAS